MADAYLIERRYDQAEPIFLRLAEPNGPVPGLYYRLGTLYLATNRYQEALTMLNKTLTLDPESVGAMNSKVHPLIRLGAYKEAENLLEQIFIRDPANVYAMRNQALLNQERKGEQTLQVTTRP